MYKSIGVDCLVDRCPKDRGSIEMLHKGGKSLKVITTQAGCSQSDEVILIETGLEGKSVVEKGS